MGSSDFLTHSLNWEFNITASSIRANNLQSLHIKTTCWEQTRAFCQVDYFKATKKRSGHVSFDM